MLGKLTDARPDGAVVDVRIPAGALIFPIVRDRGALCEEDDEALQVCYHEESHQADEEVPQPPAILDAEDEEADGTFRQRE